MYFFKFILTIVLGLLLVYYLSLSLHLFGIVTFTEKSIEAKKLLIPFYYWFH
jgi:hypothetical protein